MPRGLNGHEASQDDADTEADQPENPVDGRSLMGCKKPGMTIPGLMQRSKALTLLQMGLQIEVK